MSRIEYDKNMLEQDYINRFLNKIAIEYDGGLARQFEKYYIAKCEEIERLHSIIKEVRENMKEIEEKYWSDDGRAIVAKIVLEILDKGE